MLSAFQLVLSLQSSVASHLNVSSFTEFVPLSEQVQVVAGLNYYVRVKIGENEFIQVVIYQGLGGAAPIVSNVTREE